MSRLRVALETQFAVGTPTGLGVYAAGLARALRARDDVDVVELRDERFDLWRFDRRLYWDQIRAPALVAEANPDVVHFTGGTLPLLLRHPAILTMHDIVWLRGVNSGRFYVRWYYGGLQRALSRRADAIVVDTDAAADDVAEGLAVDRARISVAGAGIDDAFFALQRQVEEPPFALCVGTVERRKDLVTAVRAVAAVRGLRLVSVGPFTPYVDEVRAAAAAAGAADRISLRGYVSDAELLALYARAAVLLFPSRYEGFGLPPLQALACGLPVVAARIAVTEEVLTDCAAYAPCGDAPAFAELMKGALDAPDAARIERGRARARAFNWGSVAERVVGIYRSVGRV